MPLSFSDDEITAIMRLAEPVPIENRAAFFEAIAAELAANGAEVGPGAIHRVARSLQRRFVEPPPISAGKYC
jgi:hypothetical protein